MKKKCLMILVVLSLCFYASPVFAKDIYSCSDSINGALIDARIPEVVSTIVTVIKIAVPVLLVIFGMLDLMKGITAGKEDEIKKGQGLFVKRLISGALVFFVFTIVQLIVSFAAEEGDKTNIMTCAKCFINGDCTYMKNSNGTCPVGTKLSENKKFCVEK